MFIPFSIPVTAAGRSPERWIAVLHGIYGRGSNWRAFARKFCADRPEWGMLLVDLRMHGNSQLAPGPHTLQACADDVRALLMDKARAGIAVEGVLGHSFGGKVALALIATGDGEPAVAHRHTWIVDSTPSSSPRSMEGDDSVVVRVLGQLKEMPRTFSTRDEFVAKLRDGGFAQSLALWLAMNLEAEGTGYRYGSDLTAMTSLLADYYQQDYWKVIEEAGGPVHFVIASEGSVISDEDQARLQAMALRGAIDVHHVRGSHWLHVDGQDALLRCVSESLPVS